MSIYDAHLRESGPVSEREVALLQRLLSDPFNFPPEFWNAIRTRLSNDPPDLTYADILGFDKAALRAAPAIPQVTLSVNASAANTDLPKATSPVAYVLLGPGGGTIRSIAEPFWEGARVTLKNDSFTDITLKHNDVTGGTFARPLLLREGANVALKQGESIEFAYVDTFWQDVARSVTPPTTVVQPSTTLPGSPADGQRALLVDSLTAPTFCWELQYESGVTDANKWLFVGGASFESSGGLQSQGGGNLDETIAGNPTITVPRTGVYLLEHGAVVIGVGSPDQRSWQDLYLNGVLHLQCGSEGVDITSMSTLWRSAYSSGDAFTLKHNNTFSGSASWAQRYIRLTPIRVA